MMAAFGKHFDQLQSAILEREHDPRTTEDCQCHTPNATALYRCADECFSSTPSCQQCLLSSHKHHPFHHVQKWTGAYFERVSLGELGFTLYLGHRMTRCPNAPAGSKGRPLVIVNTNGIHSLNVEFCYCVHATDEPFQLTSSGLFPATIDQPTTAFTFAMLKDFHAHTLASKKSAYDHFSALRNLTNNAFPDRTPVSVSALLSPQHDLTYFRTDIENFCV